MSIETAFIGRLGGDIELRTSKAGKPFASASVAVGTGDATQWVRVVAFGSAAEHAAATLSKGDAVYCEGSLRLERWMGKDGQERGGLSVVASTLAWARVDLDPRHVRAAAVPCPPPGMRSA